MAFKQIILNELLFPKGDKFLSFFHPSMDAVCLDNGYRLRRRQGRMYPRESMTILILFHLSHYRDFQHSYLAHIWKYHHNDFPTLLCYTRFISVAPSVLIPRVCVFVITSVFPVIRSLKGRSPVISPCSSLPAPARYRFLLFIWRLTP